MTSGEYIILMSLMPVGALVIAGVLFYLTGPYPADRK